MTTTLITRRCATLFAAGALATAAVAPAASAMPAHSGPSETTAAQDLRSPDARDASVAPVARRDLRSPDTRDVAADYAPEPVAVPEPVSAGSGDGLDWVSGAIGAASVGGLILVAFAFAGRRRSIGDGHGRGPALHA